MLKKTKILMPVIGDLSNVNFSHKINLEYPSTAPCI